MELTNDSVFGLLDPGKRVYNVDTQKQVDREEFQAQKLFHLYLFGPKGLADTLGPTWQMIHDPRFIAIENAFVRVRKGVFGGDATLGIQRQQPDGSFSSAIEDLNQYSEILGEGRYFHSVLRSMAYHKAIISLYPGRPFSVPRKETLPGIFVFNQLSPEGQKEVAELAATYTEFYPKNLAKQSESAIWGLIRQECPNYFSRKNVPNQVAKDLFSILRLDLVGLIDDYAEIAKVQEWVLLDEESTLVEPEHIDSEAPHIWVEVELLERALTIRASLRVTAAQIIRTYGLHRFMEEREIKLTDLERDQLLQVVYESDYPDDPTLGSKILFYLSAIKNTGKTLEEREAEQCHAASGEAKAYVAKLKSGEEQPITRYTDPAEAFDEDEGLTEEDKASIKTAIEIQRNPLKMFVFMRYTAAEKRRDAAVADVKRISAMQDRVAYYEAHPEEIPVFDPDFYLPTAEEIVAEVAKIPALQQKIAKLTKVVEILAPVFERPDYPLTEESAAELLGQCEEFDSTTLHVVPHPDDVAEAGQPQGTSPVSEASTA